MAKYLSKEQRTVLVKFLAYLGLVRWYNLFLIALAQYLAVFFVLEHVHTWQSVLANPGLHFLVFSSGLIIAGGYLVNAFYDQEKDLANNPNRLIIGRVISKGFALNTYLLFTVTGVLIGYLLSWQVSLFYAVFAFLLWFYSHKLKKITFIGNLVASLLSICSFFVICVYYKQINTIIIMYVVFILLLELVRQIIKDMEAIRGDLLFGYQTLPVRIGLKKTKTVLYLLMLLGVFPVGYVFIRIEGVLLYFLSVAILVMLLCSVLLVFARRKQQFEQINNILKVLIVFGVVSLALF